MINRKKHPYIFFLTLALEIVSASFFNAGCSNFKKEVEPVYENTVNLEVKDSEIALITKESDYLYFPQNQDSQAVTKDFQSEAIFFGKEKTNWRYTKKRILVFFGYDFNTPEVKEKIIKILENNFGLSENDGLISTITYPDSFKRNGRYYVSDFTDFLINYDEDLAGIIILGAPERTHIALGRLQDYWNMQVPYPIISLFPQDDILGMESTCDLVLDKLDEVDADNLPAEESSNSALLSVATNVLISSINYMVNMNGGIKKDSSAQAHAVQMVKGKRLQYYLDPESGLHAINHFIIF
ncbi:MAG: hypothetical protein MJ188_03425 [Treponema sp.]|nr:hypothetical protein [Treponema sp.]